MNAKALVFQTIFVITCFQFPIEAVSQSEYPRYPNLKGLAVATITDSISCAGLVRNIMRQNSIIESNLKEADVILTVVRSSLSLPLNSSYRSIKELQDDIEMQLNISGYRGHIYVFKIGQDLSVSEFFHSKFEWSAIR